MMGRKIFKNLVKGYKVLNEEKIAATHVDQLIVTTPSVQQHIQPGAPAAESDAKPEKKLSAMGEMEREDIDGFEIPEFKPTNVKLAKIEKQEAKLKPLIYPLMPLKPKAGEPVFAHARILWDRKLNKYTYRLVEPEISPRLRGVLGRVKTLMEQRLDVDFSKLKKFEAMEYLTKQTNELIEYFDFRVSDSEKRILKYYIERDFMGLGKIEPIMRDPNIEDISCDGLGIPIYIFHRNPKLGSIASNVMYNDPAELDSFITRLSQLCGKSISVAEPLVDGSLPDGSRLQATLATDIARRGSNFTIRKFSKTPLTPIHLLSYNTTDVKTLAYLWFVVENGFSILVCGGTASGKTTLLNVLSLFIRSEKKIVSIEDTAELRLPHPHWVPTVARVPISEDKGARGEVDLFDLLKESMRQRPDYIIVGEVRGPEAYILFQQMATGHPSLATIHAENMPKLMDRLTTPPISLQPNLIGSLDMAIFLSRMRYKDNFVRRITEVVEVVEYDEEKKVPVVNKAFKWNSHNDKFISKEKSHMLKKISDRTGMKEKEIKEEIERRMLILNWMNENQILDFKDVNKVIDMYYSYPQRTISMIMERM